MLKIRRDDGRIDWAALNDWGRLSYAAVYARVTEGATPEVKTLFDAWWNGGKLWIWNPETHEHDWAPAFDDYDAATKADAHGRILEATSRGCG